MSANNKYLGKWVMETKEGEFQTFNVVEVEGEIARAINKNIPISELGDKYVRPETLVSNPFETIKIGRPDLVNEEQVQDTKQLEADPKKVDEPLEYKSTKEDIMGPERGEVIIENKRAQVSDPEEQLIENAIKLSKKTSEFGMFIKFDLNFDFEKIKLIAESMEIPMDKVAAVIFRNIQETPKVIHSAIENQIKEILNEPKIVDGN